MSGLWTTQQREWLQAMGHAVWSLAPAEGDASATEPARDAVVREASKPVREERRPAPARSVAHEDRLMQALQRVVGDGAALAALDIDLAALRGNAAAKRALWPRLRALRAKGRVP
ncbi:hypothetical protein [Lysobacter panacisoli]|uniref:Alanine acetyltransferase n=1 Tax=Lysobacter panacisoli TaxID=1255263 RepID=A0ABP9L7Q7_9GAMM|nr:hypothetical protein [Lysobacter panacisoli]